MYDESVFERPQRSKGPRFRIVNPGEAEDLPHSLEAEEGFLSCCLQDEGLTVARGLASQLTPAAFHHVASRILWEKMAVMHKRAEPIDEVIVAEELRRDQALEAAGGLPYLMKLTKQEPTTARAGYFLERLLDLWLRREALKQAARLVEECRESTNTASDVLARMASKLQRMADFAAGSQRESQRDAVRAAREAALREAAGQIDRSRWLYLGLPYADAAFLPYDVKNEDWYVVLAAPPSRGKSSVARQLVGHNCEQGKVFVVVLLETSRRRWVQSLAASYARVNLRAKDQWLRSQREAFEKWMIEIESWMEERLWVFDDLYAIEDIERTIREINRTVRDRRIAAGVPVDQARGIDGAVVDYLQLIGMKEKFRGQREEFVAKISRALKLLFKGIDITGFVLSQLNRKSTEENRRPLLSDLRESGAIEQDADGVLFLHTPREDSTGNKQDGTRFVHEAELIQAKRRNGPRDVAVDVLFYPSHTRYEDAKRQPVGPGKPKPADGYKREGAR
jgi:replicative DNA helicase